MKFGEKLIEAGLIDRAQLNAGLSHQKETGQMIGEALMELGYISEENLLKFLAKHFNTQFVSTKKLSRISISDQLLGLVPQPVAEINTLFPVLFKEAESTLGIVSAEPQNTSIIEDLRVISGTDNIQVFVASREGIQAAIKKHYKSDINAFTALDKARQEKMNQVMELYSDRVLKDEYVEEEPKATSKGPAIMRAEPDLGFESEGTSSWTRQIEAVRTNSLVSDNDFIETLNILVGLLEMQREHMQGHSAKVVKWTKAISERLGLKEREVNHCIIAAYLHDLGKRASVHLTLMSISQSEDHRRRAKRYHLTPARLFDSVHLPPQVNRIIGHLYECFDGTGLPEQLMSEGIPTGSRIIAAVDAFEDLINNPTNPMGQVLDVTAAMDELRKYADRLFDPQVVEMLAEVITGEEAKAKLSSASPLVLLADPDNSATSVLELKLVKKGFKVRVTRDSESTMESLQAEKVAAMFLEMRMSPEDGFQIIKKVKAAGMDIPIFMVSSDPPPEAVTRAFSAGIVDFITKPFVPEVIVAKLSKELSSMESGGGPNLANADGEEEVGTVVIDLDDSQSGEIGDAMAAAEEAISVMDDIPSLSEEKTPTPLLTPVPSLPREHTGEQTTRDDDPNMPPPPTGTMAGVVNTGSQVISGSLGDKKAISLIKALSGKRKTGLLSMRLGDNKGMIYFEKGHVFQALLDDIQAEEAFLELATWTDCVYKFDPEKTAKKRDIQTSTGKLIRIAELQS